MGGGNWSNDTYKSISTNYQQKTQAQVFTNQNLDPEMNPKGVAFRESRDSADHPNSIAVMLLLDETGSMGLIPENLVKNKLGSCMNTLIAHGVPDVHIMFGGIGDAANNEEAPLQVGQFEAETTLLDKWLTKIYLEGNGGGNGGESYALAWLFAARHTSIDCFEVRGEKGFLFTIGDEWVHPIITAQQQQKYLGYTEAQDLAAEDLLREAQKTYHVYHLLVNQHSSDKKLYDRWRKLMGENVLLVDDVDNIAEVIATTVAVVRGADLKAVTAGFDANVAKTVTNALAKIEKGVAKTEKGVMKL